MAKFLHENDATGRILWQIVSIEAYEIAKDDTQVATMQRKMHDAARSTRYIITIRLLHRKFGTR